MSRADAKLLIGCALAVVVPAAVLHAAAGAERHAAGATAAPFALPRVLVAHLVLAVPLGLLAAARLRSNAVVGEAAPALWPLVGAGLAGLTAAVGGGLAEALSDGEFGAVPLLLRAAIALALVLPWCVWATESPTPPAVRPAVTFGLALLAAVLPAGLYAEAVCEARAVAVNELVATGRLARADRALASLCELGSERPVMGKPPSEARRLLRAEVARLSRAAGGSLPPSAPPAARLARAEVLIRLDRLDEAAASLAPLAPQSPMALLLLATVDRDRERWAESDAGYESALARLLPIDTAEARGWCRLAFEGLAYNARSNGRPADAEAALRRGLAALPAEAAHFHFLLGRHYSDGGRTGLAVEHLEHAARLDPASYREPADNLRRQIRTHTPACLSH